MDLHLTWTPVVGTDVTYTVEYRIYLSGGPFIVYSTTVTNNYVTIPGLPDNFYEARIKADCSADYIYDVGGKDPCQPIGFGNPVYQIVEDTITYQKIKFNFSDILPSGATLKITNVNTNTVVSTATVASIPGSITITLDKVAGQTITYKVEIANNCPVINWQLVGDFTLTGPPPAIVTKMEYTSDFCGPLPGCSIPSSCDKPNSGIRFVFAEPLPQTTTFVFDFYRGNCTGDFKGTPAWYSDSAVGGKRYLKMTVPAGVTTYGEAFWRDGGEYCAVHQVCIVSISPATYGNGKKLSFPGVGSCYPIKQGIPQFNVDAFAGCRYST